METLIILGVVGVSLYGIYQATEPSGVLAKTEGPAAALHETPGAQDEEKSIRAQDAREIGFVGRAQTGTKSSSVYASDIAVADPGAASNLRLTKFKTDVSNDHTAFIDNYTQHVLQGEYVKPIISRPQFKQPLIGLTHPGAEIKSGQNIDGGLDLLSSNPFTYAENTSADSRYKQLQGRTTGQTFGTADPANYQKWSETRMSWSGLRNPWNIGGTQYNLNAYAPLDKDQLRGTVPLNDPRKVLDVAGKPSQVIAPPSRGKDTIVFNQPVRMGRQMPQRR